LDRLVKRFFGKKRGEHNMRSDRVGGAWWGVFSALFLGAGCWMLANLLQQVMIPEWRANNQFRPATCRVIETNVQEDRDDEGRNVYRPNVRVRYEVEGKTYDRWTYDAARMFTSDREQNVAIVAQFKTDHEYPCWYDPLEPEQVVLTRGYSWHAWLFLVLPVPFIAIGGGGLVYAWLNWGKSEEQRSVLAQRVARQPLDRESAAMRQQFPYVPSCVDLTNSTGTQLAYRLPNEPVGWSVLGLSLASVAWLGLTSIFVTMSLRAFQQGQPEWFLTLFATVSTIGGVVLIGATIRRFMVTTGVGPTLIEIDHHPLHPGGQYDWYINQSGRLSINRLRVLLVCEEEAHFQQGTNLRIETLRVHQTQLFAQDQFEITPERPLESRGTLTIPLAAMHSFEGEHNKINWRLIVEGDVAHWPDFRRTYSLIVQPRPSSEVAA
jgi:hypothetical protein